MVQKNQPGYPLPSGDLGEDEIICQLVYFPDRPEYRQAFLGAYHYLTTWRAWERDDAKRGKDAAANWRAAFELTMECWRMACLEQLQEDVSNILRALEAGVCCPEMDPTDGDQYTDDVEDGVGNVPQNIIDSGYAEDASDWEGFDDYKCMVAHVVVSSMESKFRKLAPHVDNAALIAGGIAAAAIIISTVWTAGLSLLLAGLITSLGGVALFYDAMISGSALETLADKIATNHDALACAFYQSDGLAGSVAGIKAEIAVLFNVAEEVLLDNSGLDIDAKALYAGRYDEVDTAAVLEAAGYETSSYDCSCAGAGEMTIQFPDADQMNDLFNDSEGALIWMTYDGRTCMDWVPDTGGSMRTTKCSMDALEIEFSLPFGRQVKLISIEFDIYLYESEPGRMADAWYAKLQYQQADSNWQNLVTVSAGSYSRNEWHHIHITESIADACHFGDHIFRFGVYRAGQGSIGRRIAFDDVHLEVIKDDCE